MLLTDVLTCPRCGPDFGLVLLADHVEERRVLEGWLGCANCRERFPVQHGFADLRFGTADAQEGTGASEPDTMKIAALLGVTEGPALVLVVGPGATRAAELVDVIPGLEVIAAWPRLAEQPESSGVSRIGAAERLPIRNASMRGVAVTGGVTDALVDEAARVAAPRARVVIASGGDGVAQRLIECGLRILARDASVTVAERPPF